MDSHISGGGEEILLFKYYSPSGSFTFRRRRKTKRNKKVWKLGGNRHPHGTMKCLSDIPVTLEQILFQ